MGRHASATQARTMNQPVDDGLSLEDRELIRRVLDTMGVHGTPTFQQVATAIKVISVVAESLMAREQREEPNSHH